MLPVVAKTDFEFWEQKDFRQDLEVQSMTQPFALSRAQSLPFWSQLALVTLEQCQQS